MRPALLVALTLVQACSFDLGFDGTRYQCGEGDRCPAGQSCVAGVCTADPEVDAAIDPDGAVPAGVCGNLSLLRDDFGPGDGARWYPFSDTGAMVAEANGALVIDLPAGMDAYAGYQSAYVYDLHGGALETEVLEVSSVNTILEVRDISGANAQLVHDGGEILAGIYNVPNDGVLAGRTWNPAERFWRIREDAGDMVWELSTDRQAWSELHRAALPFPVDHVRGTVSAGGPAVAATRARFADINLDGTTARFCPVGDFRDDFAAAPFTPEWDSYNGPGCTIAEQGGDLVMTFTGTDGNSFCGLNSLHIWDLTQGAMVVDGTPFPSQPSFVSYVQAAEPGDGATRVEFIVDGTTFEVRSYVDGATQGTRTATVDRVVHKFWRIRAADAATAVFDTSRDGVMWVEFTRMPVPWDLSAIEVSIGAGNYGMTNAVTIRLPGVNAP